MIAALTVVVWMPTAAALVALGTLAVPVAHRHRTDRSVLRTVAEARLADSTWRVDQVRALRYAEDCAAALDEMASRRAYVGAHQRHPLAPRPLRGIDLIAQQWAPAPLIGRPPLDLPHRRTPTTLVGASS